MEYHTVTWEYFHVPEHKSSDKQQLTQSTTVVNIGYLLFVNNTIHINLCKKKQFYL